VELRVHAASVASAKVSQVPNWLIANFSHALTQLVAKTEVRRDFIGLIWSLFRGYELGIKLNFFITDIAACSEVA
jgi:hypothetical protein